MDLLNLEQSSKSNLNKAISKVMFCFFIWHKLNYMITRNMIKIEKAIFQESQETLWMRL